MADYTINSEKMIENVLSRLKKKSMEITLRCNEAIIEDDKSFLLNELCELQNLISKAQIDIDYTIQLFGEA